MSINMCKALEENNPKKRSHAAVASSPPAVHVPQPSFALASMPRL